MLNLDVGLLKDFLGFGAWLFAYFVGRKAGDLIGFGIFGAGLLLGPLVLGAEDLALLLHFDLQMNMKLGIEE